MARRLASKLDIEFVLDFRPAGREPALVNKRAERNAVATYESEDLAVIIAAI